MKLKYPVLALAKCKQIFYLCRLFCIKICQNVLQSPLSGILFCRRGRANDSQKTAMAPPEVLEEPSGCSVDWGLWWLQITSPSLGYNDKTCRVFLLMKQTCGCETACKVKFVIPPKGILWSHLGSTVASSCCLRQLMFPQAPPSQSWGWWTVRVKKPTGD